MNGEENMDNVPKVPPEGSCRTNQTFGTARIDQYIRVGDVRRYVMLSPSMSSRQSRRSVTNGIPGSAVPEAVPLGAWHASGL